jgi:hypothetical protein
LGMRSLLSDLSKGKYWFSASNTSLIYIFGVFNFFSKPQLGKGRSLFSAACKRWFSTHQSL